MPFRCCDEGRRREGLPTERSKGEGRSLMDDPLYLSISHKNAPRCRHSRLFVCLARKMVNKVTGWQSRQSRNYRNKSVENCENPKAKKKKG